MTDANQPPAFAGWWQSLPEDLRESYRTGPAIMAAYAGWVAATEAKDMEPEQLTPVDWRTLEPMDAEALFIAGSRGSASLPFRDWFDARWSDRMPFWAKRDAPSDMLALNDDLWLHEVACYWGTLTPEQRREHPAYKLALEYAENRQAEGAA